MAGVDTLEVEVVWSPAPRVVERVRLALPAGSTVAAALQACGCFDGWTPDALAALSTSVWTRLQPPDHTLRAHDRVEVCRPLKVDPKEARRLRYRQHAERAEATKRAKAAKASA